MYFLFMNFGQFTAMQNGMDTKCPEIPEICLYEHSFIWPSFSVFYEPCTVNWNLGIQGSGTEERGCVDRQLNLLFTEFCPFGRWYLVD